MMHSLLVPTSASRDSSTVATWIAGAVGRQERVLYKHAPSENAAAVLGGSLPAVGLDPGVLSSGQVQLADTTELRIETGGWHEALYALHLSQLRQARREGFTGLALTGDAAAMHTITRNQTELSGYERDLERLAVEERVPSLCRYPRDEDLRVLGEMLAIHYRDVADDGWSAEVVDGLLRIAGELDFSNAERFRTVLCAAVSNGVRTIDTSKLEFCDVAGVRALVSAASVLQPKALPLKVVGLDGVLLRILGVTGMLDRRVLQVTQRDSDT
jgi:anti-anti-sigma factor